MSGSTPMTTCLFYTEYIKLGHMDSKTVAPPSLSFNKPGWCLVLAWPLMKIASVNKDIQETIASTLQENTATRKNGVKMELVKKRDKAGTILVAAISSYTKIEPCPEDEVML